MILLKTKIMVEGLGPFNDVKSTVYCQLQTFTENLTPGEYVANGRYYYTQGTKEDKVEVKLESFTKTFTAAEADALFAALDVQYPEGATYSEKMNIDKMAATHYVVGAEKRFGLTAADWVAA